MRFLGKGKAEVKEVIQSVSVTPFDVGTLTTAGQSLDAVVKVQTSMRLRDPLTVTGLASDNSLVSVSFVSPNIVRATLGSPTSDVSFVFNFSGDAT